MREPLLTDAELAVVDDVFEASLGLGGEVVVDRQWVPGVEELARWCRDDSDQIRPVRELAGDVGWALITANGVLAEVRWRSRAMSMGAVHMVASMLAGDIERLAVMTDDSMGPWVDEGIVVSLVGRMSGHISELLAYAELAERGELVVTFRPFE